MVTIIVKFRPSAVGGKAGTVFYQITYKRQVARYSTAIHILPEEWDASCRRISAAASGAAEMQKRIDTDVSMLRQIAAGFDRGAADYSARDVADRLRQRGRGVPLSEYLGRRVRQLRAEGRNGTASNYLCAHHSLSVFLGGHDISIASFTPSLIDGYNSWLVRRGMVRNTVSFYMRTLRAMYNSAVREGLVGQSYPFANVYTGVDRTRKLAAREGIFQLLGSLELSGNGKLRMARDLFLFSYCTRGMAFVDMAFLKKSDVRDGYISYNRRKTGQHLCIRVEPCMEAIMGRYACGSSPYVFPILKSENAAAAYREYRTAIVDYDRKLLRLSKHIPGDIRLSSYVTRHSWATAARNHDVPIAVISAALGHTSERTTRIYLASLENSVIDKANAEIIGRMKRGPKP